MQLDNTSFLGRMLRRTGRFGIALLAVTSFGVAGIGCYLVTALTMGVWFPKLCIIAAFGAAMGTYKFFEHFDMIPEDSDKLLTLSLTEQARETQSRGWVSSDRDPK